jgi:hypothetical protein
MRKCWLYLLRSPVHRSLYSQFELTNYTLEQNSTQVAPFSKHFVTLIRKIKRDVISMHMYSCKVMTILVIFKETCIFSTNFRKMPISNLMKIRPEGVELFRAGGQTD